MTNITFYKISCNDNNINDCYIGRTNNFNHRKAQHKYNCNSQNVKHYNYKLYNIIRKNGGWENWNIQILENNEYNNINDIKIKENKYIYDFNASLNTQINNCFI